MKKVLAILGILIVLFLAGVWYFYFRGKSISHSGPKPVPIVVSKHSDQFNNEISEVLRAYYDMTEGFVNWDTATVNQLAATLAVSLDNVKMDELKADTTKDADKIYLTAVDFAANAKNETSTILHDPSWDKKRQALNSLTDDLRNLLITVKYDRNKIYYQECPMAFDDNIPGYWLSPDQNVRNPYLGTLHPVHGSKMLHCGKPKDSIDFVVPDSLHRKD